MLAGNPGGVGVGKRPRLAGRIGKSPRNVISRTAALAGLVLIEILDQERGQEASMYIKILNLRA
jgi:hypothetical protein